jgi:hypothetical protein
VLHLHRGTPHVYQGEELGMANAPFARVDDLRDVESVNYHRSQVAAGRDPAAVMAQIRPGSRDTARTPMQWGRGARRRVLPPGGQAVTRELDGVRLLVLAHWGAGDVTVQVPDGAAWADAEVLLGSSSGQSPATVATDGTWRPDPWDAVVLRLER